LDYTGTDKAELDVKLNDAVVDVLRRTRCYVASTTISLSAGTSDYTLSTSILSILTMYGSAGGTNFRLEQVSPQMITDLQTADATTSTSSFYYSVIGANLLSVWPTPVSSGTLTVRYVPRPTALSGASDDPSSASLGGIPSEYHYALELYALWKMADSNDDQSSSQGERYRVAYEGENGRGGFLGQMKSEIRVKAGSLGRVRVNSRRKRLGLSPSTDLY
jgi:hypothetical protein